MKLLMILVLAFYGCLLLAEELEFEDSTSFVFDSEKVCEIRQGGEMLRNFVRS